MNDASTERDRGARRSLPAEQWEASWLGGKGAYLTESTNYLDARMGGWPARRNWDGPDVSKSCRGVSRRGLRYNRQLADQLAGGIQWGEAGLVCV